MTSQLNSRLIILIGISALIHAFVFLLTFSKASSSAATNRSALTVSLMQLPQYVVTTTVGSPLSESALKNGAKEPIANLAATEKDINLVKPSSEVEVSSDITTLPLNLPQPIYYGFNELDQVPTVLENIEGDSPELIDYPQGGTLKIQLWVDEFGRVINAEVVESELPARFSEVAVQAFLQVRFTPGLKNNVPVRSMAKIVVHYAPLYKPA